MKKETENIRWSVPLILFLILCILSIGVAIIKELKKKVITPPVEIKKIYLPEIKKIPVAIIIDDLGWNRKIVKEIEEINVPLTLSILPKSPYGKEIFEELKDKNFELLVHLPLEPMPPSQSFDKGLIKVDMTPEEIYQQLYSDLKEYLPYIKGVNNHMGSLFTSNPEKMEILLTYLKEMGLFFVDSMTSPKSVGYILAKEMGIKTAKRDVFLDNSPNPQYIMKQIEKFIEIAKKNGKAIAIGHAKKITIDTIKEMLPVFEEEGIEIVPVSSLLE